MKRNALKTLFAFAAGTMLFVSCDKDNATKTDVAQTDAMSVGKNSAAANDMILTLMGRVNTAGAASEGKISDIPGSGLNCGSYAVSPTSGYPKTIIADFGSGCSFQGVSFKGKLIAVLSARPTNTGAEVKLGFDQFFYNNKEVSGTATITNKGKNGAGYPTYDVLADLQQKGSAAETFWVKSALTVEHTKGFATLSPNDDAYSVTGSGTLTDIAKRSYTSTITKALVKDAGCFWIGSGTLDNTLPGGKKATLDFGDGSCDSKATLTSDGKSSEIDLGSVTM
ncbi:MAG: hypothetical protein INR69_17200 [Mucilaginibacter polytrichastri]|nr:hypothetical protein [Mucilaginibacter polytrichastri]